MISLYRAAYQKEPRAAELCGESTDEKPTNVQNGSYYTEIDTGKVFRFDEEHSQWYEQL